MVRGMAIAQAARDLDLHDNLLRRSVHEHGSSLKHGFPGQGLMKPEQLEIARLRNEVARLKAERDILKKAAAYFAKDAICSSLSSHLFLDSRSLALCLSGH